MMRSSPLHRFRAASSSFNEQDWVLLGAIACEEALSQSTLEKLSPGPALAAGAWLARAEGAGLVVPARPNRTGSLKPHFAVHADYRELVLRALAERAELAAIARVTRALLTVRSLSDLNLALQAGALDEFRRRFALRKQAPEFGPTTGAEWLRRALCEPFDAAWLERVWQADARRVSALVLVESAGRPASSRELYDFLAADRENPADPEDHAGVHAALYQQAILRGEFESAARQLVRVPERERALFSVATDFARGELPKVNAGLEQLLAEAGNAKRGALPDAGALAPLLALLAFRREDEASRTLAKRLLAAASGEANRGAQRALRTFLRHLTEPPEEQRRLDVHQLSSDVSGWEIAILGLTMHLHSVDQWARANWCQLLVRRASDWQKLGYAWFSRQTLLLAELLHEQHFKEELSRLGLEFTSERSPRELVLWELFSAKPEWQRALEALSQISDSAAEAETQSRRVAWFVDLANGVLSRPALQEFRAAQGWSDGRRVSLSELWPLHAELPREDQRVLDCTRELGSGAREFSPDAPEALIGHPRVLDGTRARALVNVVRGTCRVETREERGHVELFVVPAGAELGVNVVPEGEHQLSVYRVTPAMNRVILALRGGMRIPKSHERELVTVLAKLSESVEVHSPELGGERTIPADARPCLRFSLHAGAWLVELGVRPFSERGRFFFAGTGRASLTLYSDGQRLRCARDLELECVNNRELRSAVPTLANELPPDERSPFDAPDSWTLSEEGVLALLSELRDSKQACELEWPESGGLRLSAQARAGALHGRLRVDKGWYLVTGGLDLADVNPISLSELATLPSVAKGRFVRLPNGDFVELATRIRRVVAALKAASVKSRVPGELRLAKSALFALNELADRENGFEVEGEGRAWLERVARLSSTDFPIPDDLRATLRPYQVDGFRWLSYLSELGLGACLADDMGLGKTVQIIALLLARAARSDGPALVVAPTSVCGNWLLELKRFAPSLSALDYAGKDRAALRARLQEPGASNHVLVCSYTLLQQDHAELAALTFGTAVLDEAQFIKNAQSLRAKAALSLSAKQRIVATGTPVENHLGDLWSIFQFLNPALLGDWPHFRRTYVLPVERDGMETNTELLRKLVRPFVLRRLKRDVLRELPPITEVRHEVDLSRDEALRYGILRKQIHDKLYSSSGRRFNKIEVLSEIMRLRRFCCHPELVFPDAPRECSKLNLFLDLVEELRENEHRALVFSQFVDFLNLVREQLDERGISYEYLDGSTPQAERQARVTAFQTGSASLFLISLKAGGFGLNLTAADYVIHLDPWWNPAVEAQATDRAHRIGQERAVTVYRLITRDTIEASIVELHRKKRRIAESLLDGTDGTALRSDDLLALLGEARELDAEGYDVTLGDA
ncbi:MAG TPA: DEAD/DEAH box helicase [Polyangiaceae bacterium]|jgi:superfamily II DNA or RNA helicase